MDNPFLNLFESSSAPSLTKLVAQVFEITDPSSSSKNLIPISQFSCSNPKDSLEHALFERLMMESIDRIGDRSGHAVEVRPIPYLTESYLRTKRLADEKTKTDDQTVVINLILRNLITAFTEPAIYGGGQDVYKQFADILGDVNADTDLLQQLMNDLVQQFRNEDDESSLPSSPPVNLAPVLINPMLDLLRESIRQNDSFILAGNNPLSLPDIRALKFFVNHPDVAEIFVLHNFPSNTRGSAFGDSIFGLILSKSCIPESALKTPDYYENPSTIPASTRTNVEGQIWFGLQAIHDVVYHLFKSIIKHGQKQRHLALMWVGDCLKANANRGKLWTSELLMSDSVSDGFMLNLGSVLLKLCDPFTKGAKNPKILKVDPMYTNVECFVSEDRYLKGVHLMEASREPMLIPKDEDNDDDNDSDESANSPHQPFNFITDIYFLTQKTLDLGFRVVQERIMRLNRDLMTMQEMQRDAIVQGEAANQIHDRMEFATQRYLCFKTALMEPETVRLMMQMTAATSSWIVNCAIQSHEDNSAEFAELTFPLENNRTSRKLKYVPEMIVENICEFLLLARRFSPQTFEDHGQYLPSIVDFILTFMGSTKWVRNPHLRARMAECLDCLLPCHEIQGPTNAFWSKFHREEIFQSYPHRLELIEVLLNVFVSIETTGQSVEFEQKFSYRKPMYDVITYLWEMEDYRNKFVDIADEAEVHIEDEEPPIFLRFVNLLINDAIFLLDEALNFMKQIQEQQAERDSWRQLSFQERGEREAQYSQIGRLARYHNIMGRETIKMLDRLTGTIKSVFTHPTLVDRIASMLNYFLKNLVGPERKSFKVQNLDDYNFKPGGIVTDISKIYINFMECPSFLLAVSQDGRSYSNDLFDQAQDVLTKICEFQVSEELHQVAQKVRVAAESQQAEDELFADPPDEFLDPIMSVLMKDPVQLPGSGITVDRQTIARHLLSDQSDPFNRMPLSMDKVIPDNDLKRRINEWMEAQRDSKRKS